MICIIAIVIGMILAGIYFIYNELKHKKLLNKFDEINLKFDNLSKDESIDKICKMINNISRF